MALVRHYNIALVLLGVFSLMLLASVLSSVVGFLEWRLLAWKTAGR